LIGLASIDLREQMSLYDSYDSKELMHLQVINTAIAEVENSLASYLRSPKASYRVQMAEHIEEFYEALTAFDVLALTNEELQRASQLSSSFSEATATVTQLMDLQDKLDLNTAIMLQLRSDLVFALDEQVQAPARLEMRDQKDSVHSVDSRNNKITVALLVVGIVFVFGAAFFVFKRITKPVRQLVVATQKVAGGDLSVRVEETHHDEIGLLSAAFNEMIATREEAERALLIGEEEQRRLTDENAVNATIGRIVSSSLDITEVYDAFAKQVRTLVRFDWLAVPIFDQDMKGQRIDYVSSDSISRLKRGTWMKREGTFIGSVADQRDVVAVALDYDQEMIEEFPTMTPVAKAGFHGLLGVPLFSRDRVIGVLTFASKELAPYTQSEIAAASTVADQVAGAIAISQTYSELQEAQTELL